MLGVPSADYPSPKFHFLNVEKNLRGSWQHGVLLWKFHYPYIKKKINSNIWNAVTISLWPLESWRLKTVVSAKCWRCILMNPPWCTPCFVRNKWLRNVCIMESEIKHKYSIKCLHWTYLSIQPHFLLSPLEPFTRYNELHAVPYSPHAVSYLCVLHCLEQHGHPDLFLRLSIRSLPQCLSWPHSSSPYIEMTSLSFVP